MNDYNYPFLKLKEVERIKKNLSCNKSCQVTGCADAGLAHFISGISKDFNKKVIVTFSATKALELYEDFKNFQKDAVLYPAKDLIFFNADIHSNFIIRQRFEFLRKLVQKESYTVILTPDAFLEKIQPLEKISDYCIEIKKGDIVAMEQFTKQLIQMGYESTDQVTSPGQFSIRGSIIDIYTLTEDVPYRIDLWDEEVDLIKSFEVESQRTLENQEMIRIYSAGEYILTKDEIQSGINEIKQELEQQKNSFRTNMKTEEAHRLRTTVGEFLNAVELNPSSVAFDSYVNYFCKDALSLMTYLNDAVFFLDEPVRIEKQLDVVSLEFEQSMSHRLEKGYILPGQSQVIWDKDWVLKELNEHTRVMFTGIGQQPDFLTTDDMITVSLLGVSSYNGKFDMLTNDLKKYQKAGYALLLLTSSATRGKRLAEDFKDFHIHACFTEELDQEICPGKIFITTGRLRSGFIYPTIQFAVLSDSDIFGLRNRRKRRKHHYKGNAVLGFTDLKSGDYVVHENYGLGIYRGIEKVEVDHTVKDYIKIEYAGGSNLYVMATQLDVIQKYADSSAKVPKLNRIGGQEWKKTKSGVKKAVAQIAKELVELYAIREHSRGYAFHPDSEWQREFEETFPFEETDDQLQAINEVKKDMESPKIMDRLICGDVGFGKTEIAIRAAFKAVQDNKQVAYLVPTTVLAQQHYKTFRQRFENFPVRVELLSRFRTKTGIRQTLEELKNGYVDIVIGTHRLLSQDVQYHDLGLLIIDEEQRFGVKHKEKIKELKKNVDVLTLTATPIPRTLHMSLIGIRDMCVMEEAPLERMPIQTFVMEFNEEIARDAIHRELARGGQVYYVYNRVRDIADMAVKVQTIVPEARVAYAHGQLTERHLEDVMYDFVNGDIDVLVTTTIIETGLDIPNANTIIIHNAERMGLSQLYQLRGRVGRSNRTAYAFLMYGRNKLLTEIAEKRLGAIRDFTELGSGVKIAMRDLEIRGTGNLLGAAQSGHMEEVGYDLYCKLLNEEIGLLKGNKRKDDFETKIDLNIDAFIPSSYISNETLKMDVYKRIAEIKTREEYEDMQDELMDRFGDIPVQVDNLLRLVLLKSSAHRIYVTEVQEQNHELRIFMWPEAEIDVERIPILIREYKGRLRFVPRNNPYFVFQMKTEVTDIIETAHKVIEDLSTLK